MKRILTYLFLFLWVMTVSAQNMDIEQSKKLSTFNFLSPKAQRPWVQLSTFNLLLLFVAAEQLPTFKPSITNALQSVVLISLCQ